MGKYLVGLGKNVDCINSDMTVTVYVFSSYVNVRGVHIDVLITMTTSILNCTMWQW